MNEILDGLSVSQDTPEKPITHTLMNGGKLHVPRDKLDLFYKRLIKYGILEKENILVVEKMGDIHPLVVDIDIKYDTEITVRQYTPETLHLICSFLWSRFSDYLDISDSSQFGEIWIMEKETPYPCVTNKKYASKDGIHIAFPRILLKKDAYKKMILEIKKEGEIEKIFEQTCEIKPSNGENELFDGCFTSWQPYGCSKKNESHYKLTNVYTIENDNPCLMDSDTLDEYYGDNLAIAKSLSVAYRDEETVKYTPLLEDIVKGKKLKKVESNGSIVSEDMDDDIYGERQTKMRIILSEEELKFIKDILPCLSQERVEEYANWISVGMCLHNISETFLDAWKDFSKRSASYSEDECDKKWQSFHSSYGGDKLGPGSLKYWARLDNVDLYNQVMREHLSGRIWRTIFTKYSGPDSHHIVNEVIHKYFEDRFICVDMKDEWFYFNGTRWERTMKANELKKRMHGEIWDIYKLEADKYRAQDNDVGADICLSFQKKLLREEYVATLIKGLGHMFYKKDIMEEFDTNHDLLGFENGIYDLKKHIFREGLPEDYITMSTGISLPVSKEDLPISLEDLIVKIQRIEHYTRLDHDFNDFLEKILPDPKLRVYMKRFMSKCISGENRDEGFYIWTGSGGNGKSKLVDLIVKCLGSYTCNLPVALLTQKRKSSGAADPEMARTRGRRFVYMQEPDVNETLNIGEMKEITGNDTIQARSLYKEPFEFTPQFKLVLMCNDKPKIPSNDDGTWRRLQVAPFISRFVDEDEDPNPEDNRYLKDKSLKRKLEKWVFPMYAMLFKEWKEYNDHGIGIPDCVKETTSEYRNENDIVGQWISAQCVEADNEKAADGVTERAPTPYEDLHSVFKEWCEDQELTRHMPEKTKGFKTALLKWQSGSKYGLKIAKNKQGKKKPNGTNNDPLINLKIA